MSRPPRGRRRWLRWSLAGIGVIVVALVGASTGVTLSTHAPAPLALPRASSTAAAPPPAALDGEWNAGRGSSVGWRAQQVLIGEHSTLAGRTGRIWGSITIASGRVTQGEFSVDVSALTGNLSRSTRDSVFDVTAYPTARLRLTGTMQIGDIPADGVVQRFAESAILTIHGVSRAVHFTVSAELLGGGVHVLADIPFPFGRWGISVGGVPLLADIESPATIEVLLDLSRQPGNTASTAALRSPRSGAPR